MGSRVAVFPAGRQDLYTRNRYSAAVASGGFLFVSGQVGSREDGSPEPDPEAQLRLAFQNLNAVLVAGGCSFDDVIDFTIYLTDPENDFAYWGTVAPEFWGEPPYPTLTGIGVTWLYGFRFELKVTARIPGETA
ncbi:RidA family protein [Glacieibacterium frigidum]|uniref:RidA family protein n=1 Tax=Glacieibacterium frigidum TaxID=2593303 RepID=A0A552U7V2_9SPHN|nr:RidA family protein [Glacieibacterium frigidum]TRW14297.1 RidA family protein [Glacieibacterium frigidum]